MYAKKSSAFKLIALMLCLALLIGGAIGGTLAYLMTQTTPVTNTFVAGNIGNLELDETGMTEGRTKSFMVTPGVNITKDPTVTFSGNNVPAYVFVKVDQTGWTQSEDKMTYSCINEKVTWTVDPSWALVPGTTNVYSRTVAAQASLNANVIKDNTITVAGTILQSELTADAVPNLAFSAYAVQQANGADTTFTPAEAWAVALNNGQPDANP